MWRKTGADGWQSFTRKHKGTEIKPYYFSGHRIVCVVVLEDHYVKSQQGSRVRWAVSCRFQATIYADRVISNCLGHVHSAARSLPLCTVACAHHEKGNFPRAHSEAVHGSAVTAWPFLVARRRFSGLSYAAGVRALVLFKGCLAPYCPRNIASWLFCLLSLTDWHLSFLS